MTTSVYLIRHGAYVHRPSPQGEAASDFGLSDLGRQQAAALRDRLARTGEIQADALCCSTLPRARDTAAVIAPALGLPVLAMAELCEWESGNEALGEQAFMAQFQGLEPGVRRTHRFHSGAETIAEFTQRVQGALSDLLRRFEGRTLVLVVHGGVIEAAFAHFLGFGPGPFEGGHPAADHTSITLWRRSTRRGDWVQVFANDTHHLRPEPAAHNTENST